MQIKIKRTKEDKDPIIVSYDFGADLDDSASKFDGDSPLDKVVHGLFLTAARAQLQEFVRKLIAPDVVFDEVKDAKGKKTKTRREVIPDLTLADIQAKVDAWKPVVERAAKRSIAAAAKVVGSLSEAERNELLKQLTGFSGPLSTLEIEPQNDEAAEEADED